MNGLMVGLDDRSLDDRNRRLRRILLGVVAALVVVSFLVGIRW